MPGTYHETAFLEAWPGQDAIVSWLKHASVDAGPSKSGQVANHILESVGGVRGMQLLRHESVIKLLDKMAKSVTVREFSSHTASEEYPDRTATVDEWKHVIGELNRSEKRIANHKLKDYTSANMLRLGLSVSCPNCQKKNWYSVNAASYHLQCEQCLSEFDFPQGEMNFDKRDWSYRVIGPFTEPNFADGAYSVGLALELFSRRLERHNTAVTWSTGLDLKLDGESFEVDFVCLYQSHRSFGQKSQTLVVFGEAKSFGTESIEFKDIQNLKRLAVKFPGCFLAVAVLKKEFSEREKRLLRGFVTWGRHVTESGDQRAPVILLTAHELLGRANVAEAWANLGGRWKDLIKHASVRVDYLWTLADLTQQIYLDLPSRHTWLEAKRRAKQSRKAAPSAAPAN